MPLTPEARKAAGFYASVFQLRCDAPPADGGAPDRRAGRGRLHNVSKTGEHSRAQQSTPEHNELTTRQRISNTFRRKSRAISQLAF